MTTETTRRRILLSDTAWPGQTRAKAHRVGTYSRPDVLAKLDGRTREAALMRRVRDDLVAHVGGNPSATEKALIERAVWLSLHLAQLDAKMARGAPTFTQHDSDRYIAWSNCLTRTLARLGLKPSGAENQLPDIADILRDLGGAAA